MRVLILTCNTGGGHNACAKAIQEVFAENGHVCALADSIHFVSDKLSHFMSWGHTTMYRHVPGLFRFGYDFAEKHPSVLKDDAAAYKLLTGGTEQLAAFLQAGGYDTVLCTHVFSGLLLRQTMREYALNLKTAFVATDYTCSPGTAKSDLDCYFIPADCLRNEFIEQGVPERKIIVTGIPVSGQFYKRADKAQAKQQLGIDPRHPHLLMMCGSMGCGPMEKLAQLLSTQINEHMELSVICGTNEKLQKELTAQFGANNNMHIYGFVQDVGAMMDSADLYLTKPGGLSTSEALAKHLPMVFVDAVAGCEEHNLRYFVSLGGAVTANTAKELADLCVMLLNTPDQLSKMSQSLAEALPGHATQQIYDTMAKKAY